MKKTQIFLKLFLSLYYFISQVAHGTNLFDVELVLLLNAEQTHTTTETEEFPSEEINYTSLINSMHAQDSSKSVVPFIKCLQQKLIYCR